MAALSSFALSVLSVEQAMERNSWPRVTTDETPVRPTRAMRRATSHYNSFQSYCSPDHNPPPSYITANKQKQASRRGNEGQEALPSYTSTVTAEAKVLLNLELISPLHAVSESEWREVWVVVRGTMVSIYRVKDGAIGKHLRTYTLQHAEVGLAIDTAYTVLTPNTKLAHLIPGPARTKAFKKDPKLFKAEKQHILRVRLETDQLLFAQPSEEKTFDLINAIAAGIDISQPIDERSATRQCTVPRRRRRQRPQFNGDVNDPSMIAEQERILREMYPSLLNTQDSVQTPSREEDEIDVGALREDTGRPVMSRSTTQNSIETSGDEMTSINITADGKWQPPHTRTAAQDLRYNRRCMPVLLAEAVRASDILICNGRRVRINWRVESLEDWELKPPSYKSHGFDVSKPELARMSSIISDISATRRNGHDEITPVEEQLSNLELSKMASAGDMDKTSPIKSALHRRVEVDTLSAVQGVVYCF